MNKPNNLDKMVILSLQLSFIGTAVLVISSWMFSFSGIWALSFFGLGMLFSASLMIAKGAKTGKRYARGAKSRRIKWLPMLGARENTLKDEVFRIIETRHE